MTRISQFNINTHFTALKQRTALYQGNVNVAAQTLPAYTLGKELGSVNISVPAGIYVETILIRTSYDGNINHLTPQVVLNLGDQGYLYISVNQQNNSEYKLEVIADNFSSSPLSLATFSAEALIRLAISPFD